MKNMIDIAKLKESFTEIKKKNDETFVYFIAFLYGISTGEIGAVDLINTGQTAPYGRYSKSLKDVYNLGVGWSRGGKLFCFQ